MTKLHTTAATILVIAFLSAGFAANAQTSGSPQPADKMAVAGSALEIGTPGQALTLLTGTMKTSAFEDAVITVSAECSILTSVTTVGNDDQKAFGQVEVWVELDGTAIPVASDDTGNSTGHVVFCNRAHEQETMNFPPDASNATIKSYLDTRNSDAFTWITLNIPAGDHTFVVKATLTTTATNHAIAQVAVGKRTLVVDPTHLAVNAEI
jgi:hypothetical protein